MHFWCHKDINVFLCSFSFTLFCCCCCYCHAVLCHAHLARHRSDQNKTKILRNCFIGWHAEKVPLLLCVADCIPFFFVLFSSPACVLATFHTVIKYDTKQQTLNVWFQHSHAFVHAKGYVCEACKLFLLMQF